MFNYPNKIGPATWAGWVQERGLYFLGEKDPKYVDLVSMVDSFKDNPGEKLGSFVEAKVGKGRWIYLGLGLVASIAGGNRRSLSVAGQPDQSGESTGGRRPIEKEHHRRGTLTGFEPSRQAAPVALTLAVTQKPKPNRERQRPGPDFSDLLGERPGNFDSSRNWSLSRVGPAFCRRAGFPAGLSARKEKPVGRPACRQNAGPTLLGGCCPRSFFNKALVFLREQR